MSQFENLLSRSPEACTLPTVERPLRVAEFADLFASAVAGVRRVSSTEAVVILPGEALASARDLAARETACCSFFDFSIEREGERAAMTIRVPARYADVLTALTDLAGAER